MNWGNPFSFKGNNGRLQLWLTLIVVSIAETTLGFIPITTHNYKSANGLEVSWVTPLEPVTIESWMWFAFYCVGVAAIVWLLASAMARRLHDLGYSANWLALFFCGFVAIMVIALWMDTNKVSEAVQNVVAFAMIIPLAVLGMMGYVQMFFIAGYKSRHDRMSDGDLRKPTE